MKQDHRLAVTMIALGSAIALLIVAIIFILTN